MKTSETPYKAHVFVCVKSRNGERKSCGDGCGPEIRNLLKEEVGNRGWKPFVRISESSCLGVCDAGPNLMIYPQQIWLSGVGMDDLPHVLDLLETLIEE